VLGLSVVLEGASWLRAFGQARQETRDNGRQLLDHVRRSPDITFKGGQVPSDAAQPIGWPSQELGPVHQASGQMR
jgi:hypothetical protein